MLIKKRDADVIKYIFDTFNDVNLGKLGIDEAFKLIQARLSEHIKSEATNELSRQGIEEKFNED